MPSPAAPVHGSGSFPRSSRMFGGATLLALMAMAAAMLSGFEGRRTPADPPPPPPAEGSPLADLDGDGSVDRVVTTEGPGAVGQVRVISGSSGATLYTVAGAQPGDGFGYGIAAANVGGGPALELLVSAPRSPSGEGGTGRVYIYAGADGLALRQLHAPPSARIGLRMGGVADQDGDGVRDLAVEGGWLSAGQWRAAVFVFSGGSGRFLARREAGLESLRQYITTGGRVFSSADLDDDGIVDELDVIDLASRLGAGVAPYTQGDLNGDGTLGPDDVYRMMTLLLAGERTCVRSADALPAATAADMAIVERWDALYGGGALVVGYRGPPPAGQAPIGPTAGNGANPSSQQTGQSAPVGGPIVQLYAWPGLGTPCACGVPSEPSGAFNTNVVSHPCPAQMYGCPERFLHVGDEFGPLTGVGTSFVNGQCEWSIVDPGGVITPDPDPQTGKYTALRPGTARIRLQCTDGGCCGCRECIVTVVAEPVPCPQLEIMCIGRAGGSIVAQPNSDVVLRVRALPPPTELCPLHFIVQTTPAGPPIVLPTEGVLFSRTGEQYLDLRLRTGSAGGTVVVTIFPTMTCSAGSGCGGVQATCEFIVSNDADGDGLPDHVEEEWETDPNDPDSDDDGFCDGCEDDAHGATHGDTVPTAAYLDPDRDGLSTLEESCRLDTGAVNYDTDYDGLSDPMEFALGLSPRTPYSTSLANGSQRPDRLDPLYLTVDWDQDGVLDTWENKIGLDPHNRDVDGDQIHDGVELASGTDPRTNLRFESGDTDGDGLSDYEEVVVYHSNPNRIDSDGDGLPDGFEARVGLDPRDGFSPHGRGRPDPDGDLDFDGLSNLDEMGYGSDPLGPDTDGDGTTDGDETRQGTSPIDESDGGSAENAGDYCRLTFVVGNHIGSNGNSCRDDLGLTTDDPTEGDDDHKLTHRWGMTIVGDDGRRYPPLQTMDNGRRVRQELLVPKGHCFTIRVQNLGALSGSAGSHPAYYAGVQNREGCCVMLEDIASPGEGPLLGEHCLNRPNNTANRTATLCLPRVDSDADTDNTGATDRSKREEDLEVSATAPSKLIAVNDADSDGDGVPGFADGYNRDGSAQAPADADDLSAQDRFTPVIFEASGVLTPETRQYTFTYSASDPAAVTIDPDGRFVPADGRLRLWKKDGNAARNKASIADGGDYVPPGSYTWMQLTGSPTGGTLTLYAEALSPSAALHDIPVGFAVSGVTCTDTVPLMALEIKVHDLRYWGPSMVGSDNLPALENTDLDADISGSAVGGAITDGASICLVRVRPVLEDLPLQVFIAAPNTALQDVPEVLGALFPAPSGTTLPPLPAPADPRPAGWSCQSSMVEGKAFYVPPDAYLDYRSMRPVILRPSSPTPVAFTITLNGTPVGSASFRLRRPPVVLVHGLMGSPVGYWDPVAYSETPSAGSPLGTRLYFADYAAMNTKGYDEIFPSVPKAISEALEDYHTANDNLAGGHDPAQGFEGVRYAATRVDAVGHSMGGQAIRTYISNVSSSGPRQAASQWTHYNFGRTPTSTGFRVTYQRASNFGMGDIRRFIAIGSPFKGSPLANAVAPWLEQTQDNLLLLQGLPNGSLLFTAGGQYIEPTAVHDLMVGGTVQGLLASATYPAGAAVVPWTAMVGLTTQAAGAAPVQGTLWQLLFILGGDDPDVISALSPANSDLIVNQWSQRNASHELDTPNSAIGRVFDFHVHSNIAEFTGLAIEYKSPNIAEEIGELLSRPRTFLGNGDMGR